MRLWVVKVMDLDPQAGKFGRSTEVKVKIAAEQQPVPPAPAIPGYPPAVEFTDLTVTPYTDSLGCKGDRQPHKCKARQAWSTGRRDRRASLGAPDRQDGGLSPEQAAGAGASSAKECRPPLRSTEVARVTARDGAIWRTCVGCGVLSALAPEVDRCAVCLLGQAVASGWACVVCGASALDGRAMVPAGFTERGQLFACATHGGGRSR